jgi:(p)ppGpp synthase/HD superfamily hydrolase
VTVFELQDWVATDRRRISRRFTEALAIASELHAGQRRKGSGVPYISHLLGVTAIAFEYGADESQAIAALLHDAIEDAPPALGAAGVRDVIGGRFGAEVLAIVEDCTDADSVPKPPWRARKIAYVARIARAVPGALLVSASDKLHNVRSILTDFLQEGDAVWDRFSPDAGKSGTIGYYRGLITAFDGRRGDGAGQFGRLVDDLDATLADLERHAGETGRWPPA